MLDDALVERFSRQILLDEIGGRGQARLCAATALVDGGDAAASFAATLLAATGMRVVCRDGDPDALAVVLADGAGVVARRSGASAVVATVTGRPCPRCLPPTTLALPFAVRAADPACAQAVGALVAAEASCIVLGLATSRLHTLDLDAGRFVSRALPASDGCAACGARG